MKKLLEHSPLKRVLVAVLFGLIGFLVNFQDIELFSGSAFKISILAGLYFPLVIALAWGWRYGLLSALAGGCQSMWWLWRYDGWGVIYAAPVFTLWIVWHGWWADRRTEGHSWRISSFMVEIPFRVIIELGFYTVFRWLVSFNPPPWNPAITWDHVPLSWVHIVAVKHVATSYVLLLAAYATLSMGNVRRFFDLPPRPAQTDTNAIFSVAFLLGLMLWGVDAIVDAFAFHPDKTFVETAILDVKPHEMFMRILYIIVLLIGAAVLARFNRQRVLLTGRLAHQKSVLAAIRNINQLITHEKDRDCLLAKACGMLVEARDFHNAWIVLIDDGKPAEPFFQAGLKSDFAPVKDHLKKGLFTACMNRALVEGGLVVVRNPLDECPDCPLATTYGDHSGLTRRLEFGGHVYGLLSVSVPRVYAFDQEEQALFTEVAEDIAFALNKIKTDIRLYQLDHIVSTIPQPMSLISSDYLYLTVNRFYTQLYRKPVEDIIGHTPGDLLGQAVFEAEIKPRLDRCLNGESLRYDVQSLFPGAGLLWMEMTYIPYRDKNGAITGVISHGIDITGRKQMEENLRESEARFRRIYENIAIGVGRVSLEFKIVSANESYCRLLGYTEEELTGKHLSEITHPETLQENMDLQEKLRKGEIDHYRMEKQFIHKKGHTVHAILDANLILDAGGAPLYFLGSVVDITDLKRAQVEKEKLQLQLQHSQKMESIGALAGGIAHDFNNMLGVIYGNTSYALSNLNKNDELYEVLTDVQSGARQAQQLTQQLLTFAKGGAPIKKACDLNSLIKDSANFILRGAKAGCEFVLAEDLWPARADQGQIHQVVGNLVLNANQAMPEGGIITVKTENEFIDEDSAIPLLKGKYVRIIVKDQGVGVSKKHLPNIFDPFFTTKRTGSGLGLATAYSIIKKHGGHISVYSEIDRGTVFHVYLPASEKDFEKTKTPEKTGHRGRGRILIMDDQEPILKMVGRMIGRMGYETDFATDGSQAVEKYRNAHESKTPFDLVILDLTVPGGMGGAETIRELHKIDPMVKAIVSSGYSNDPIMADYKSHGFCAVAPKPYSKGAMAELLSLVLGEKG